VDYCLFCAHGVYGVLRPDNTALLSRLVSERGSILPKRFTHCCAKHQRKLAATLRRARSLNYIPFHSKLHPRLRFGSMSPALPTAAGARMAAIRGGGFEGPALGRPSADEILAGLNPTTAAA
jgi:small subunit ribosomal protein S18